MDEKINGIKFIRIKNCKYGNPRYIFHALDFEENPIFDGIKWADTYKTLRSMGAKNYRAKGFNNWFALSSYNLRFFIELLIKNLNK